MVLHSLGELPAASQAERVAETRRNYMRREWRRIMDEILAGRIRYRKDLQCRIGFDTVADDMRKMTTEYGAALALMEE